MRRSRLASWGQPTRRTVARVAAASGAILLATALITAPASAAAAGPGQLYYGAAVNFAAEQSSDWAGYDVTDGDYKSVSASWTQPTVTCSTSETSYSAFWVGLDGDGSESVEQIGTSSDCDNGTPSYSAWYEFYPEASKDISATVKAGDKLTATVTSTGNGSYELVLADRTQGWTKTETGTAPDAQNASAEIIAEAPSSARAGNVLSLANFHTVKFTGVKVNGKAVASDASAIDMVDSGGSEKASASDLSSGSAGASFSVDWKSSGSTGQSPTGIGGGFGQGGTGTGTGTGGGWGQGGQSTGDSSGSGSIGDPWGDTGTGSDGTGSDSTGSVGSDGNGWQIVGSTGTDDWAQAWQELQQQLAAIAADGRWVSA